MAAGKYALSARGRQAAKSAKPMPDSAIDFSDIPESTDEELRKAKRVGRPGIGDAGTLIAIRIRPSLLARIQKAAKDEGKACQTFIHEILEQRMKHNR